MQSVRSFRQRPGIGILAAGIAGLPFLLGVVLWLTGAVTTAQEPVPPATAMTLDEAKHHFYNARFPAAVEVTRALEPSRPDDLALLEVRSSALLFQLKALLERKGRRVPLKECAACPALLEAFATEFAQARKLAQAKVAADPEDLEAKFFLGKLDLNHVWLQLGPLGKKTGWGEYWEARRALDEVLAKQPDHIRARVARAWIDYIVDTRMPWGTEWLLGGGDRKRALKAIRESAAADGEFYAHTEAEFALWEMLVRDRDLPGAMDVARRLARDFPENRDIAAFLENEGDQARTR